MSFEDGGMMAKIQQGMRVISINLYAIASSYNKSAMYTCIVAQFKGVKSPRFSLA